MSEWDDIIQKAREIADKFQCDGSMAWFRGHRCDDFDLVSTIHRHVNRLTAGLRKPPVGEPRRQLLYEEYKTVYRRFKADAWPLLNERERSDWGIIFTMQHYGVPTRLLDWTESFACAVFFAQLGRKPNDTACIWVLDPHALNRIAVSQDGFVALDEDMSESNVTSSDWHPKWPRPKEPLPSIATSPIFTNPRMTAQRSAFTLSGDAPVPLDQEFPQLIQAGCLIRIPLPPSTFAAADRFLESAGLNAFSFYPDLQGLAMRHEKDTLDRIAAHRRCYPDEFEP